MTAPLNQDHEAVLLAIKEIYERAGKSKTVWVDPLSVAVVLCDQFDKDHYIWATSMMGQLKQKRLLRRRRFEATNYYALTKKGRDKCWQK